VVEVASLPTESASQKCAFISTSAVQCEDKTFTTSAASAASAVGHSLALVQVPAFGVAAVASKPVKGEVKVFTLPSAAAAKDQKSASTSTCAAGSTQIHVLENELLRAEVGSDGRLKRVLDKRVDGGREVLAPGGFGNAFVMYQDQVLCPHLFVL
jgi:hypothetical protein